MGHSLGNRAVCKKGPPNSVKLESQPCGREQGGVERGKTSREAVVEIWVDENEVYNQRPHSGHEG